jgi:transposase-like protein
MAAKLKSALLRAPRRTWSVEERRRIVDEALSAGESVARVARRHGLNANLVFKWIGRSREGGDVGQPGLR